LPAVRQEIHKKIGRPPKVSYAKGRG